MKKGNRKSSAAKLMAQFDAELEQAVGRNWETGTTPVEVLSEDSETREFFELDTAVPADELVAEQTEAPVIEEEVAAESSQAAELDPTNPYGYIEGTEPKRYNQLLAAYKRKLHNAMRLCHVAQEPKGLRLEDVERLNTQYQLPAERAWRPGAKFAPVSEQTA